MTKREPRPALGPPDRVIAAVALLAGCALLALLVIGFSGESVRLGSRTPVTVQGPAAENGRNANAPGGFAGSAIPDEMLGRRLGEGLVLAPRMIEGRIAGYVISAESDAAMLSGVKLKRGDMLIDLDGRALEPARIRALGEELATADSVEVTYLRDGQVRKRVINLGR